MYKYMVIYRKTNGDIIYRARSTKPEYEVGQQTSMGWEVLDIRRLHKGRTLSNEEYDELCNRRITLLDKIKGYLGKSYEYYLKLLLLSTTIVYFIVKIEK